MELFIFLVTLLKDFTFSCIGGPDSINLLPQYSGFANVPRNYEIIATPRWRGFTYLKKMYIVCRHLQFVGFLVCILDLVLVLLYFSDIRMMLNKICSKISSDAQVHAIYFIFAMHKNVNKVYSWGIWHPLVVVHYIPYVACFVIKRKRVSKGSWWRTKEYYHLIVDQFDHLKKTRNGLKD